MNAVINKKVVVIGHLKTVDVGDGESVTELDVLNVESIELCSFLQGEAFG